MSKKWFIGDASNKARKSKKLYIGGVDNKSHKIKKIYIGDANNKARVCYTSGLQVIAMIMGGENMYYATDFGNPAVQGNRATSGYSVNSPKVVFGNNIFVAIFPTSEFYARQYTIAYSYDGINWTNNTTNDELMNMLRNNSTSLPQQLKFINGLFIITGQAQTAYSADGITWKVTGGYGVAALIRDITYCYNTYFTSCVDTSCVFKGSSLDSLTPTYINMFSDALLCTNGSIMVGVSASAAGIFTVDSAGSCTLRLSYPNYISIGAVYGNGKFLVVIGFRLYYSTDGVSWTLASSNFSCIYKTLSFNGSVFIMAQNNYNYAYSKDGINWTTVNTGVGYSLLSISAGNF